MELRAGDRVDFKSQEAPVRFQQEASDQLQCSNQKHPSNTHTLLRAAEEELRCVSYHHQRRRKSGVRWEALLLFMDYERGTALFTVCAYSGSHLHLPVYFVCTFVVVHEGVQFKLNQRSVLT